MTRRRMRARVAVASLCAGLLCAPLVASAQQAQPPKKNKVVYEYDEERRLTKVKLPEVKNKV